PRRGRPGADVAVPVPAQEAPGKVVRISAAAAEPLHEEGGGRPAVEVRERHAQQFVLLDAAVEVLDQRRHAVAAAHRPPRAAPRPPEARAGVRDQWLPAMAQPLVNRDGHGTTAARASGPSARWTRRPRRPCWSGPAWSAPRPRTTRSRSAPPSPTRTRTTRR